MLQWVKKGTPTIRLAHNRYVIRLRVRSQSGYSIQSESTYSDPLSDLFTRPFNRIDDVAVRPSALFAEDRSTGALVRLSLRSNERLRREYIQQSRNT